MRSCGCCPLYLGPSGRRWEERFWRREWDEFFRREEEDERIIYGVLI